MRVGETYVFAMVDDLVSRWEVVGINRYRVFYQVTTLASDPAPLRAAAGVAGTARAEHLSVEQFCALARALASAECAH